MKPKIFITFAPLKHSATSCCGKNCLTDFRFNNKYPISIIYHKVNLPKLLPTTTATVHLCLSIKVNFKPFTYILYV